MIECKTIRVTGKRCYECEEYGLEPWEWPETLGGVSVLVHGLRCPACGEGQIHARDLELAEREAARVIMADVLRTDDQCEFVRKVLGLTVTSRRVILSDE